MRPSLRKEYMGSVSIVSQRGVKMTNHKSVAHAWEDSSSTRHYTIQDKWKEGGNKREIYQKLTVSMMTGTEVNLSMLPWLY